MHDPLKDFVEKNRHQMDAAEPSANLWNQIEKNMIATQVLPVKSNVPWLKYFGFGASAVAIAFVVSFVWKKQTEPVVEKAVIPVVATTNTTKSATVLPAPETKKLLPPETVNTTALSAAPKNPVQENPSLVELPVLVNPELPAATDVSGLNAFASRSIEGNTIKLDTLWKGITRLEISTTCANVKINAHASDEVRLAADINYEVKGPNKNNTHYVLNCNRTDTVLHVTVTMVCDQDKINFARIVKSKADLDFNVPAKINLLVNNCYGNTQVVGTSGLICDLRASSGDLKLESINGNPSVASTYGDVTAANITGNIKCHLSSGQVKIANVTGDVDARSTYGDVLISNVTGAVRAISSSGQISLGNVTGDADLKTTYGDINLTAYKGILKAVTSSGSIRGKEIELTGNTNLTTTYGDISLTLKNQLSELSFDLNTTYGDIVIEKDGEKFAQEKKLSLQKGAILIKATTSSGSQTFH